MSTPLSADMIAQLLHDTAYGAAEMCGVWGVEGGARVLEASAQLLRGNVGASNEIIRAMEHDLPADAPQRVRDVLRGLLRDVA